MTKFREELQTMVSEDRNAAVHDMLLVLRDLGVVEEISFTFGFSDDILECYADAGITNKVMNHRRGDSAKAIGAQVMQRGLVERITRKEFEGLSFTDTLMAVKPQKPLTSGE